MAAAQRAREQGAVAQQVGADVDAVGPGATDLDVAPAHGRVAPAVAAICHCASSRCPSFAAVSAAPIAAVSKRSEEHTSELQSLMRISYAVFCLKKKKNTTTHE